MASTNMLQFNPTAANQENDAAYLADATRLGGALDGNGWPDNSANKTLYQVTTYLVALFTALANKGFSTSDASLSTLTAQCANFLTTADIPAGLQTVAWASTLALNAAAYSGFQITLAGATALTIGGQAAGQIIGLIFVQDSVGGRVVTYPGNVKGAAQPDPAVGTLSAQLFKVDSALNLDAVGPMISVNGSVFPALLTAGSITLAGGAPVGQVLTGNGTSFVPVSAPGWSSGFNADGYWVKDPSGLIRQWSNNASITGHPSSISFPVAFTNAASISVQINEIGPDGIYYQIYLDSSSPPTIVGFTVAGIGFSGTVNFSWFAVGY